MIFFFVVVYFCFFLHFKSEIFISIYPADCNKFYFTTFLCALLRFIYLFIYVHKCGKLTTPKLPHSPNSSPIPIPQESVNQVVPFCDSFCFYFPLRAKNYRIRVSLCLPLFLSWTVGRVGHPDNRTTVELLV